MTVYRFGDETHAWAKAHTQGRVPRRMRHELYIPYRNLASYNTEGVGKDGLCLWPSFRFSDGITCKVCMKLMHGPNPHPSKGAPKGETQGINRTELWHLTIKYIARRFVANFRVSDGLHVRVACMGVELTLLAREENSHGARAARGGTQR